MALGNMLWEAEQPLFAQAWSPHALEHLCSANLPPAYEEPGCQSHRSWRQGTGSSGYRCLLQPPALSIASGPTKRWHLVNRKAKKCPSLSLYLVIFSLCVSLDWGVLKAGLNPRLCGGQCVSRRTQGLSLLPSFAPLCPCLLPSFLSSIAMFLGSRPPKRCASFITVGSLRTAPRRTIRRGAILVILYSFNKTKPKPKPNKTIKN